MIRLWNVSETVLKYQQLYIIKNFKAKHIAKFFCLKKVTNAARIHFVFYDKRSVNQKREQKEIALMKYNIKMSI